MKKAKELLENQKGEDVKNVCMEENGRTYIYCFRDNEWKEKEVCLEKCSEGRRNRCYSWRKHIDKDPIRHRKTKRQVGEGKGLTKSTDSDIMNIDNTQEEE